MGTSLNSGRTDGWGGEDSLLARYPRLYSISTQHTKVYSIWRPSKMQVENGILGGEDHCLITK